MRHFSWIATFLTLSFIGDRLFGYFLQKITLNSQFRYSRLYRGDAKADILLVGNSRGLGFYQPEIERLTGLNTLNISYNGMPADLATVLVRDQFQKNGAPKTMVIDVTMCDRKDDLFVAAFNVYSPYSDSLKALITRYDKTVYYGGLVSHLYRHNSEVFQRAFNYRNKTDEDWLLDRVISEKMATNTSLKSYKMRVMPEMVDHLKEMIDFARSQGTDVKLVISPYFPKFAETIRDSFLTPLKTLVEAKTGLTVTDYSAALTTTEAFGDYQHANKKGCVQFMNQLFEEKVFSVGEKVTDMPQTVQGTQSQPADSNLMATSVAFTLPNVESSANRPIEHAPKQSVSSEPAEGEMVLSTASKQIALPKSDVTTPTPRLIAKMSKLKRRNNRLKNDYGSNVDTFMLGKY
ncbi:MAG: hypothetical protein RIS64_2891 [Bacteroidota bacterium]|jgi:hypothetical protein